MSPPLPLYPVYSRDCVGSGTNAQRPCRKTSCRYHLCGIEVGSGVQPARQAARREADGITETCAIDIANQGAHENAVIAVLLGLTTQRVDQIVKTALWKMAKAARKLRGEL